MATDQGMGLSNGQMMSGMDPSQMGAIDPSAFNEIPHVGDPPQQPEYDTPPQDQLRAHIESVNIAESLDEKKLNEIAYDVLQGYEDDEMSRQPWMEHVEEWTKLAAQVVEEKVYPWPKAANVKYPLISTAAMQFNARAYPSLVPSDGKIVKVQVIGKDPTGQKKDKAERVGLYMSYQLLYEMHGWEAEMDKLLLMLPIIGTMFKKTYFDPVKKKNCSHLVLSKDLVVNYWASCLEDAERVTEIIEMSPRKLKEKQLAGVFLDIDLSPPTISDKDPKKEVLRNQLPPRADDTTPYLILEQHTYLDLNDDGYKEPYIVTVEKSSQKVLRIVARFDDKTITQNDEGKVVQIDPIQYYTKYDFIPNPDGGFYAIGFGHLLGPLNEAVNSILNQLIDAGTLSNLQSGFIGKGLRMRMGETRLQPGEWRAVNGTGDDLRKQIVPLPIKEPSSVLFQLMGSLVQSGKELASVAEIFVGKMPGQNTPATTTMATIEQGMKIFTAVYKRIYRSLECEFKKLFRLNEVYLDYNTYVNVLDTTVDPRDFDSTGYDVCPGADPAAISQTEKLVKAQAVMEVMAQAQGLIDPLKAIGMYFDALEIPNWQNLISPSAGQPQPDPVQEQLAMKMQADQETAQTKNAALTLKAQTDASSQAAQVAMKQYETQMSTALKTQQAQQQMTAQQHKDAARLAMQQQMHEQRMQQQQEKHQQQLKQSKETSKSASQNKKSSTGNAKK